MAKEKQRQTILIIILIVIIIGAVVWYFMLQKSSKPEEFMSGTIIPSSEQKIKDIQLNLDVLDNPLFKDLKVHGLLPVTSGETGKSNPFQ